MSMQLLLVAFTVCIGLSSVQSRSEAGGDQHGIRENFRNLFNSINTNDMKQTDTYRNALEQEAAGEKEAFDTMKEVWRYKRQRNFNEHRGLGRAAAVKREAEKPDVSTRRPVKVGLVQECLEEMGLGDKTIDKLSPEQLGELKGRIDSKHAQIQEYLPRYAIDRYCVMNLWSAIEGVRLRTVVFHTEDEKKHNALNSQIGTYWKSRETKLRSVLFNLGSIMKSVEDNPKDKACVEKAKQNFKTTVNRLHELDLVFPDERSPSHNNDELIKEIAFLNKNWDESNVWELWKEEHKDFWLRKSTVWQSERDFNHPGNVLIVQRLVKDVLVEKTTIGFHTLQELAYLKAYIQIGWFCSDVTRNPS